jgi:hypothetical protein
MPTAPGSVKMEVSANQAKKSVAGDDSVPKMGVIGPKVKVRPGFALFRPRVSSR